MRVNLQNLEGEDLLVLALTPGVPVEYVWAIAGLGWRRRNQLWDQMDGANADQRRAAALNAESMTQEDGWAMLLALPKGYSGAVPLWSQLALQARAEPLGEISQQLGQDRQRVGRWRRKTVFCPLTGARLIGRRGPEKGHFGGK